MKQSRKKKRSPFKQLTLVDRCKIEAGLCNGKSINCIAKELNKSPSSISREISKHKIIKESTANDCRYRKGCNATHLCDSNLCKRKCKLCYMKDCRTICSNYIIFDCPDIPPSGVCNNCKRVKKGCKYRRYIYNAQKAYEQYKTLQATTREGTFLSGEDLEKINSIISPLIKNGQSPYQAISSHKNELPASESTIRRLIDNCDFDARNIDLRNQVKRKKTRKRKMKERAALQPKIGHLYSDYLEYISKNDVSVVQMDCVEGSKDSESVLLTLHFPLFHMQLAIILSHHTSECVIEALDKVEQALGKALFARTFELILTDNGHEFSDIKKIERSYFGGKRTKVFFCEPNHSEQKGACECNHKYIRYIIPKGISMDEYSQFDISLMMNHINSSPRKSLGGLSPYQLAKNVLPDDFFILLGLEEISPDEIILTPALLKK